MQSHDEIPRRDVDLKNHSVEEPPFQRYEEIIENLEEYENKITLDDRVRMVTCGGLSGAFSAIFPLFKYPLSNNIAADFALSAAVGFVPGTVGAIILEGIIGGSRSAFKRHDFKGVISLGLSSIAGAFTVFGAADLAQAAGYAPEQAKIVGACSGPAFTLAAFSLFKCCKHIRQSNTMRELREPFLRNNNV